jgi:hypothetical protein
MVEPVLRTSRGSPSTLPDRDSRYFEMFLNENDPEKRQKILELVPEEMSRALEAPVGTPPGSYSRR